MSYNHKHGRYPGEHGESNESENKKHARPF